MPYMANALRSQLTCSATALIFSMGDGFKMIRIHTRMDAAQVIEFKPIRHGTVLSLPVPFVGDHALSTTGKNPIIITAQLPNPARRFVAPIFNFVVNWRKPLMMTLKIEPRPTFDETARWCIDFANTCLLLAATMAEAVRNFHNPLQVDGSGTPGESRHLTSVSKADAQPRFRSADWSLTWILC